MNENKVFIPNPYNSDKVDWQQLKYEISNKLMYLVKQISENIDKVSTKRLRSDDHEDINCDMYSGSSGILWALFRYIQMLKNEMIRCFDAN